MFFAIVSNRISKSRQEGQLISPKGPEPDKLRAMSSAFQPTDCFLKQAKKSTLPLFVVTTDDYEGWLNSAPEAIKLWLKARNFKAKAGAVCLLPADDGGAVGAVVTVSDPTCPWDYAGLPRALPEGSFDAEPELPQDVATALCLGWALGAYQFARYKRKAFKRPLLVWPEEAERTTVLALSEGICLARDLVNTPASDMGPEELADAAKKLAKTHNADFKVITGESLLKKNYPMIHAVGRASSREPRLIDLRWGKSKHPKLTLVGKGVCFDTGGLDIKPGQFMKLMKKDMGGGALVLGLAHAVMSQKLPVRLRVLVPAVENSVSGNAMRPLDVLSTRKGITVEVGDTDAEGRLVLGDALFEADSESPDLLIDAATLTGAARVALGTGMPAIFAHKTSTWRALEEAADRSDDPLWRLPLHRPYRSTLESKVADISNIGADGYGGAITAALFLDEFIGRETDWIHMDTMGYNLAHRPGRPAGGEALGLLALNEMLSRRYGKKADKPLMPSSDSSDPAPENSPEEQASQEPRADEPRTTESNSEPEAAPTIRRDTARKTAASPRAKKVLSRAASAKKPTAKKKTSPRRAPKKAAKKSPRAKR